MNRQETNFATVDWSAALCDKLHSCADCPIRKMAARRPRSIFARIHAWHASWWPGWKLQRAPACGAAVRADSRP